MMESLLQFYSSLLFPQPPRERRHDSVVSLHLKNRNQSRVSVSEAICLGISNQLNCSSRIRFPCEIGADQRANMYEENLACIAMSANPVHRKSSRHIDITVHFCRELYTDDVMKLIPMISLLKASLPRSLEAFLTLSFSRFESHIFHHPSSAHPS